MSNKNNLEVSDILRNSLIFTMIVPFFSCGITHLVITMFNLSEYLCGKEWQMVVFSICLFAVYDIITFSTLRKIKKYIDISEIFYGNWLYVFFPIITMFLSDDFYFREGVILSTCLMVSIFFIKNYLTILKYAKQ